MVVYILSGTTGAAALLSGDVRTRKIVLDTVPLLAGSLLLGDIRPTLTNLRGTVDVVAALDNGIAPAIPPLLTPLVELEQAFRLRWSSHAPLLVAADLEADASFIRTEVPKSVVGRTFGIAELTGSFPLIVKVTGEVASTSLLAQTFGFSDLLVTPPSTPLIVGTLLSGSFTIPGAQRSPPYVQFTGTNHLARTTNDATLNPSGAFTVSVTFDPELIVVGQNCTIVAKHRPDVNQYGWLVSYVASTGIVTFTVYGATDGSISRARPTSTAIRVRSRFTALVDASGNITIYVNGATNQGTQVDVGAWTAPAASSEALSFGCDSPTRPNVVSVIPLVINGYGLNHMTGAFYDFAFWSVALSGGDAALLLPDGNLPTALITASLIAYWNSTRIIVSDANSAFAGWEDSVNSWAIAIGNAPNQTQLFALADNSGMTPFSPPLPLTHFYDSLLADRASVPPSPSLSTTHNLSSDGRWRLWSAGSITPQIQGTFRQYRGDATLSVILSRVVGANTVIIAQLYGLQIQFQAVNNFFVISGDDNAGSTNERYDYGIALAEGRAAGTFTAPPTSSVVIITLRFNSYTKDIDLFVNGNRVTTGTKLTGQAANIRTTNLLFADFADFRLASFIPACLNNAQVAQMIAGFNPRSHDAPFPGSFHPYNPSPFVIADVPLYPLFDETDAEPIPFASSSTTVAGRIAFADTRDIEPPYIAAGIVPGSVTITVPQSTVGTFSYVDNSSGQFVASPGSPAVSSSYINYVGANASGSITINTLPADGDTVTLTSTDGSYSVTFEFDSNSSWSPTRYRIVIPGTVTLAAQALRDAINHSFLLGISATSASGLVTLQHRIARAPVSNLIAVTGTNITKSDFSGGIDAGTWFIQIVGTGGLFSTVVRGRAAYEWNSDGLNRWPAPYDDESIEMPLVTLFKATDEILSLYADAPYIIKDGFDQDAESTGSTAFLSPNPVVINVTADNYVVTAVANAGPTNAGPCIIWWEIELVSGSTEVMVVADYFLPTLFSINRNQINTFPIPPGQDWNEKRIRFVIQAVTDATQIWRSLFFRMEGAEFDNNPPEVIILPGGGGTTQTEVGELLTTQERERLVIARRARLPTPIDPQRDISRYKTTKVFAGSRGLELGLMEVLDDLYTIGSDYRTYVVRSPDIGFLDRIAVLFYGEGYEWAWWTIAYANSIVDPDQEMYVGQRLVIPTRSAIQRFLARASVTSLST